MILTATLIFNDTLFHETIYRFPCRCLRYPKHLHKLLRLELVRQLAEAVVIAGRSATLYEPLVLVGEVVVSHFSEEEMLAFILHLHSKPAESPVPVVHRQRMVFLPLFPMTHQDKRQRDSYAVIWNTFQKHSFGLVVIELRNLHVV